MGLGMQYDEGQTPLDEDEKEGLLIKSITTRGDLNEWEQRNIDDAIEWSLRGKFQKNRILSEKFIRDVHKKMLGDVWKWAGEFRKTNKNIGVDKSQISLELRKLIDDCVYWIDNKTYPEDEIAIRFKHRIVSIHCFPNGNGRHSRLIADIIVQRIFKLPVFSWSAGQLMNNGTNRVEYLAALKEADKGKIERLIKFARS